MNFRDETILETAAGDIRLRSFCSPDQIHKYAFDTEFGRHAQYRSLYTKKESLEKDAGREGVNVVLAVNTADTIVGFGVLDYPEEGDRWLDLGPHIRWTCWVASAPRRISIIR